MAQRRHALGVARRVQMVDTCGAEFEAVSPYYYSTLRRIHRCAAQQKQKVLAISAPGPFASGRGIEF